MSRSSTELGVYVHFPWCLQKCPYCDFVSFQSPRDAIPHAAYAEAIIAELRLRLDWLRRNEPATDGFRLRSLFFGGGTPSLWEPDSLGRVIRAVLDELPAFGELEITVECNPSSFNRERAESLRGLGVNRISIGVQSLDEGRLKFLGRLHDSRQGLAAVETAQRAGFSKVSADLIYGISGQSAANAVEEVERLAATGLSHLSAYMLTIEPGTLFYSKARRGLLPLLHEDEVATSFLSVHEALSALGFEHYEISNFAKAPDFAEHNLGYWQGYDYLGLGCGAVGTITVGERRIRERNTRKPERYLQAFAPESAEAPSKVAAATREPFTWVDEVETIDAATEVRERLMLGLRLSRGVDLRKLEGERSLSPVQQRRVQKLIRSGKLEQRGHSLQIPYQHWLFADSIVAELL